MAGVLRPCAAPPATVHCLRLHAPVIRTFPRSGIPPGGDTDREIGMNADSRFAAALVAILTGAFIVIAPNVGIYYGHLRSYDVWRTLQIALLVALAVACVILPVVSGMVSTAVGAFPRNAGLLLAGAAGIGLISAVFASRPPYAVREVALFALLFLMVLCAAAAARLLGARFDRAAAYTCSVSALLYLIIFFTVLRVDPWGTASSTANPFIGFANPRFFGHLESVVLPLLAIALLDPRPPGILSRIGVWVAAVGWWTLALISGSRAPLLALVLATGAAVVIFRHQALPWLKVQCVALALGTVAYAVAPGLPISAKLGVASVVARGTSGSNRLLIWEHALELIRGAPLLGVGPAHFSFHRVPFSAIGWKESPAHPHNIVLQFMSEWGVSAALALAAVSCWGLWGWTRSRRNEPAGAEDGVAKVALTVSLFALTVHSFLDGMAVMPLPQTFGAAVIGWALGVHLRDVGIAPAPARTRHMVRIGAFAALVALLSTIRLPPKEPEKGETLAPAFWVHGVIP